MPPKQYVFGAMFDIRPVKAPGVLDFEKVASVVLRLDLRQHRTHTSSVQEPVRSPTRHQSTSLVDQLFAELEPSPKATLAVARKPSVKALAPSHDPIEVPIPNAGPIYSALVSKEDLLREIEDIMSSPASVSVEVARYGGNLNLRKLLPADNPRLVGWDADGIAEVFAASRISPLAVTSIEPVESELLIESVPTPDLLNPDHVGPVIEEEPIIQETQPTELPPAIVVPDEQVVKEEHIAKPAYAMPVYDQPINYQAHEPLAVFFNQKPKEELIQLTAFQSKKPLSVRRSVPPSSARKSGYLWVVLIAAACVGIVLVLSYVSRGEGSIKNNVVQNGKNAVGNMMDAKDALEHLRFADAANSFALASDDFSRAGNTLSKIGASFAPLMSRLPGLNKLGAAANLVVAGQNIARAGEDLSLALGNFNDIKSSLLKTNDSGNSDASVSYAIGHFADVLQKSQTRVERAGRLLASIDANSLPEDKRPLFILFKDKLPELKDFLEKASTYSQTLVDLVPSDRTARYIVLFQNTSERRPTGGFPGSYGLVTFENGSLKEFKVDDTYNPDGQLRSNVIPPKPLQHITPTWGMRDANWFADFPTSARHILTFYQEATGIKADGVLTITPDIIRDVLAIIGPIPMPEYNLTITADNFLDAIQEEVEYGDNKAQGQPKKILADLRPKLLAQFGEQDKDHLGQIFAVFAKALSEKHILAYFTNTDAQAIAVTRDIAGQIKDATDDYLQVAITNVKGSKTDFVTDTGLHLKSRVINDSDIEHTIEITRTHNGGNRPQRFYNLPNSAYVRVYAPRSAEFLDISGDSNTDFQPLIDYGKGDFKNDADLVALNMQAKHPIPGVDVFEESGKKVFGFWMVVKPGATQKASISYRVSHAYQVGQYSLLFQKQSGTSDAFQWDFTGPDGASFIRGLSGDLQSQGNTVRFEGDLITDHLFQIKADTQ